MTRRLSAPDDMSFTIRQMTAKEIVYARKENLMRTLIIPPFETSDCVYIGGEKRTERAFFYWGRDIYYISAEEYFAIAMKDGLPHPSYFHDFYYDKDYAPRRTEIESFWYENTCMLCQKEDDGSISHEFVKPRFQWSSVVKSDTLLVDLIHPADPEDRLALAERGNTFLLTTFDTYPDTDSYKSYVLFSLYRAEINDGKLSKTAEADLYRIAKEILG